MRSVFTSVGVVLTVLFFRGAATQSTGDIEVPSNLTEPRKDNMLAAPYLDDIPRNSTLNISNIQCDILVGMRKKLELFYFFQIDDPKLFKTVLHTTIISWITPTSAMLSTSTQPQVAINIAFSQTGLSTLGITDNLGDTPFTKAQVTDAKFLGDPGIGDWKKVFTVPDKLHGVFLIASDDQSLIDTAVNFLESSFSTSMHNLYKLQGNIRPPPFEGHEMFGYLDGIGQPAIAGFNTVVFPGQLLISAGVILVGEPGDLVSRPSWAHDGSFLAFRELQQFVPEFDKFIAATAPSVPGFTSAQAEELFGARMVGRWKSGAPVDRTPMVDDPAMAADPNQNNDFDFLHVGFNPVDDQSHCPFHAHIRKTRPRSDLIAPRNTIMRAGIPYGPEVTDQEASSSVSDPKLERGLAFVSYQSAISDGFRFIQNAWANDPNFVGGKNVLLDTTQFSVKPTAAHDS
ncbi:DyP-type peroxidase [Auriculariales sp. MPI-PUGE-AT-0066]|nr:DyP-type peroxidase [Auriculariales sp. MPI-PUGE-AT-0066]